LFPSFRVMPPKRKSVPKSNVVSAQKPSKRRPTQKAAAAKAEQLAKASAKADRVIANQVFGLSDDEEDGTFEDEVQEVGFDNAGAQDEEVDFAGQRPCIDWLVVDAFQFGDKFLRNPDFVILPNFSLGQVFALLNPDGDIETLYQHVGEFLREVSMPGVVSEYLSEASLLINHQFAIVVFSVVGVQWLLTQCHVSSFSIKPVGAVLPKVQSEVKKTRSVRPSFSGLFGGVSDANPSEQAFDFGAEEDVSGSSDAFVFRGLSSFGAQTQRNFREASAFRVLCFNDRTRWVPLAGDLCSLDAQSTWRSIVMELPESFRVLPIFSPDSLPLLLNMRFALSPSMVGGFPRPKKLDFVDLLSFSFEAEQISSVASLRELLLRLVKSLDSIAGDKGFYASVFSEWFDVLCPSSFPLTMSSWAPEYVFRWLSQRLFNVSSWFWGNRFAFLLEGENQVSFKSGCGLWFWKRIGFLLSFN
jgi:hypothetical protein